MLAPIDLDVVSWADLTRALAPLVTDDARIEATAARLARAAEPIVSASLALECAASQAVLDEAADADF